MVGVSATLAEVVERLTQDERGFSFVGRDGETRISFAALRGEAVTVAGGLCAAGLRKGDRVVAILPSERQFISTFLGSVYAGIVPVPLFPPFMLSRLDAYRMHLRGVLTVSGASTIVTCSELRSLIEEMLDGTGAVPRVVTPEELAANPTYGRFPRVREDDMALLQFTSGSTGSPKGVCVSHRSLLANIRTIGEHIDVDPNADRGVSWLPLYHDMGLGTVVIGVVVQASSWFIPPLDFVRRPHVWC
jgi:fatty-acyl-CoA synthase